MSLSTNARSSIIRFRQSRARYDLDRASFRGRHPRWEKESRFISSTDNQVASTGMLDMTDNRH